MEKGKVTISFLDSQTMRSLNRQFTGADRLTDVLSFRYDAGPTCLPRRRLSDQARRRQVAGEILIAPAAARRYATRHKMPYRQELARYVIHGLLHWMGCEDRTPRQQRRMRALEDQLLKQCDC
jgi:probable rRNA maturation factor